MFHGFDNFSLTLVLLTRCLTLMLFLVNLSLISNSSSKVVKEVILFLLFFIMRQLGIAILSIKERRVEVKEQVASMIFEVTSIG